MQNLTIWHRTRRLAKAHPFFGGKGRLLSLRAAKAMLRGRDIPDGSAVILRARAELGMPCRESAAPSPAVASGRLRRGLACAFAVLLALCLFAATDTGKVLADEIYGAVAQVFNGYLVAHNINSSDSKAASIDFALLPSEFVSLNDVADTTGRAIIVPDDGSILLSFSVHILGNEQLVVRSKYQTEDNRQFTISQSLYNSETLWSSAASMDESKADRISIKVADQAYISTMEDGTVYVEAFGDGFNMMISSANLSLDELAELALGLKYTE